jgi:hypothetical protein
MSEPMNCPKCDADLGEIWEPDDPSVGIIGGWFCDECDIAVAGWEHPREPLEDDVGIPPRDPTEPLGIPLSELSGQPGPKNDPGHPDHQRYENFKRIARSWGYE